MAEPTEDWGDWQDWPQAPALAPGTLAEILDGGQAFRWNRSDVGFEGAWSRFRVRLSAESGTMLRYALPRSADPGICREALERYFALTTDFAALTNSLPWRSDPVLKRAIATFPGLRLLRQPTEETLFCFLCSSTKQVPQIKAICEAVANAAGSREPHGGHALPSWAQLLQTGEASLRACKLGYRARHILGTAEKLAAEPDFFSKLEVADTASAREQLISLPGVGRKIADCVLLFGLGRYEAFPIDTWVQRILARAYGLAGWTPAQMQHFAAIHFGPAAGLAQQYLFAAARSGSIPS